ncbi:isopentenyl phosphate kinase [Halarchaeum acidiphilum MH1-52-1]|uniref:Isopentenyl phosphate kinase n=2 Tax=Halarchaeum acidiphilum TaxID=489138 RepID=U2YU78_9EURY|nr:isopentenyl phosphate kinase [Halarchaeum acidiphilum]GAD52292.1 isopentenyl phosphate kinase [Halarchaeum acidiphilum MH1-52-1]
MTVVLKLGGSVITEKGEPETVDIGALADAADAIAAASIGDLVLVHGGGSFGHHHAAAHGVSRTDGTRDAAAVREIHGAMRRLNDAVCDALVGRDVPAVPHHPHSAGYRDAAGDLTLPTDTVGATRDEGFVPVLHGDVVTHVDAGATILSGDELVVALARGLDADRVGVCSTVSGVLDDDGDVIERIDDYADVERYLGGSADTDVTGGMAAKVRALLDLDAPASVFGPDALGGFLRGEGPGTVIR